MLCIAHRGGGSNWPEMTAYAYEQAGKIDGLKAMEVSVHRSRDGVLVCHHDPTTLRMTGKDLTIAKTDWKDLAELRVTAKHTDDPSQPVRPIARFEEVIEAWPKTMTMWVEPKADDTVEPLFQRLLQQPDLEFVWKRPVNAPFERAYLQGMGTFGYVLNNEQQLRLMRLAAKQRFIQYLGVGSDAKDDFVKKVVDEADAFGKHKVMWPILTRADRDRALASGIDTLMVSDVKHLLL